MCGEVVFVQSGVAHCSGPSPDEISSSYNVMMMMLLCLGMKSVLMKTFYF